MAPVGASVVVRLVTEGSLFIPEDGATGLHASLPKGRVAADREKIGGESVSGISVKTPPYGAVIVPRSDENHVRNK